MNFLICNFFRLPTRLLLRSVRRSPWRTAWMFPRPCPRRLARSTLTKWRLEMTLAEGQGNKSGVNFSRRNVRSLAVIKKESEPLSEILTWFSFFSNVSSTLSSSIHPLCRMSHAIYFCKNKTVTDEQCKVGIKYYQNRDKL